eukprot:scaffold927_cov375-Prasinococcus_capsulatus_cf.AAC.18
MTACARLYAQSRRSPRWRHLECRKLLRQGCRGHPALLLQPSRQNRVTRFLTRLIAWGLVHWSPDPRTPCAAAAVGAAFLSCWSAGRASSAPSRASAAPSPCSYRRRPVPSRVAARLPRTPTSAAGRDSLPSASPAWC